MKELKASETENTRKLAEALAREEALMDKLRLAEEQPKGKSENEYENEIAKLEDENDMLKESAERLVLKLKETKTELEQLKKTSQLKDAKILELTKENAELASRSSEANRDPRPATIASLVSPPQTSAPAEKAASAFSSLAKHDSTPSVPTGSSGGVSRFAALVKAASKPSVASAPSSPAKDTVSASSSGNKWRAAVNGAVQTVRAAGAVGSLQLDDSVVSAYNSIRSDPPPISWALFSYDVDGRKIHMSHSGTGGVATLAAHLRPEDRAYGFVRVTTGDSMSARAKFIFITFVGERVPPLKKARVSTDRMVVKDTIREFALEVFANTSEELAESALLAAVRKAGGADYGSSTN